MDHDDTDTIGPMTERPRRPFASTRITRRAFLVASATGAAATAAVAIAGCNTTVRPSKDAGATPAAGRLLPAASRGGILRTYNFDAAAYDTLDPHLTQFGPIANVHSAIYSKLLRYDDERAGTFAPDLAASMPEQPDETTYVFTLREGVTFHDALKYRLAYPKTAGRALTADDVKFSIERQQTRSGALARRFFRQSDWSVIDNIEVRDARSLIITTKQRVAPFLSFCAGRHAFILPREVVEREGQITDDLALIGSGPFMLDSLEPGVAVRLRRNPAWFARDDRATGAGAGRPFVEGYDAFYSPQSDAFQRAAFERQLVDIASFIDPAVLDAERKTNLADIAIEEIDAGGILASRLLLDRAPFNDDRVRRALHLAIDRGALSDLLYPPMDDRPSARLSGPIAPGSERFAIDAAALARRAGYRKDAGGRAEDLATAKQLWSAAVGDGAITGLRILFSGAPAIIGERATDALKRQLQDALGVRVQTQVDPSGGVLIANAFLRNIDGATEGVAPFTFMIEDGGVDLDDWLYPHFRSGQPMNTYRLQDPQLDSLLDKSRTEFDADTRRRIGIDAQDYLLAKVNARLEFCAPVERRLVWGYVRNSRIPIWYGDSAWIEDAWLDNSHPAYRPRPA